MRNGGRVGSKSEETLAEFAGKRMQGPQGVHEEKGEHLLHEERTFEGATIVKRTRFEEIGLLGYSRKKKGKKRGGRIAREREKNCGEERKKGLTNRGEIQDECFLRHSGRVQQHRLVQRLKFPGLVGLEGCTLPRTDKVHKKGDPPSTGTQEEG